MADKSPASSLGRYQPVPSADTSIAAGSQPPTSSLQKLLGSCLLWLCASSTLILINRYIMVDLAFVYPMAVAAMGMGFASIATFVWCDVLRMVPPAEGVTLQFYCTRILPIGACGGLTLFLGNTMYFYLTVAFIEMSRASVPVITMAALWVTGIEVPTSGVVKAVSLTAVGCAVAAYGELHLTNIGALLALANLTMESVRLVMTQSLLVGRDMHPLQSLKYIAPAATLTLLVGSAIKEVPHMAENNAMGIVRGYPFHFLVAASLGLVVNVLAVVIIKVSSATTLKVLAAVRGPIVVLLGVMLFAEAVTMIEFFGYSIALCGFVWYQFALAKKAEVAKNRDAAHAAAGGGEVDGERGAAGEAKGDAKA